MDFKTICIFSGSSSGNSESYRLATADFASQLARRNIGIVYGGASVGLMGVAADTALQLNGSVIGVIPATLKDREIAHTGLTQLHVVESMHERKRKMYDLSDAFVALPGGFGTLDEFFEILTWGQLGMHQKPCGILNTDGYFDSLLTFLDGAVSKGFLRKLNRDMIVVGATPSELLKRMGEYVPVNVTKWIDRSTT